MFHSKCLPFLWIHYMVTLIHKQVCHSQTRLWKFRHFFCKYKIIQLYSETGFFLLFFLLLYLSLYQEKYLSRSDLTVFFHSPSSVVGYSTNWVKILHPKDYLVTKHSLNLSSCIALDFLEQIFNGVLAKNSHEFITTFHHHSDFIYTCATMTPICVSQISFRVGIYFLLNFI